MSIGGEVEAEGFRGLEIDLQRHCRRLFDGKVRWTRALEDAIDIAGRTLPNRKKVGRVRHQSSLLDCIAERVNRRQATLGGERYDPRGERLQKSISGHEQSAEARDCKQAPAGACSEAKGLRLGTME